MNKTDHAQGSARTSSRTLGRNLLEITLTFLHLVAITMLGWSFAGLLTATLIGGLVTVWLGVGVIALIIALYLLWASAWIETERVSGLYRLELPPLELPKSHTGGFSGWMRSLGLILKQGRMWIAVCSGIAATLIGAVMLSMLSALTKALNAAVQVLFFGAIHPFFGLSAILTDNIAAALIAALSVILMLGVIVGAAYLHRIVTTMLLQTLQHKTQLQELSSKVESGNLQRHGAIRAAEIERTRVERDLHDGVQPRLVATGMTLELARQQLRSNPEEAERLLNEAHTSTQAAITELRQLARGIHTSVLADRGLDAALSAIAAGSHFPVHLDVRVPRRVDPSAEATMYFGIAEALTNATKHSRAAHCRVLVRLREPHPNNPDTPTLLWARVEDDGIGGAQIEPGGGLDGIAQRVQAAGGQFRFDSPIGGPTSLEMSVPCE